MQEQIIVTIQDGKATVETKGFKGAACMNATKDLLKALGKVETDKKTPEFDMREQQVQGS